MPRIIDLTREVRQISGHALFAGGSCIERPHVSEPQQRIDIAQVLALRAANQAGGASDQDVEFAARAKAAWARLIRKV
jgi:hypothetical protein